ncbi:MAG: MOSC domain-containing protein [Candidatus Latescibacterota bacterium]|nr:MOSC domain-containing protein [Candidatus Latescibacterota bacterium]
MDEAKHLTLEQLETGTDAIRKSPTDDGVLELIARRPVIGDRELLQEAQLDVEQGLVGDNWKERGSGTTKDGAAHPDAQVTVMNCRASELVAQSRERWPLAGDQLYIDLDLSLDNLPAGTRLRIGSAILEVTALPHTGCKKFAERFGVDAVEWVSSEKGKRLNLRGINARVVGGGTIRVGDRAVKV